MLKIEKPEKVEIRPLKPTAPLSRALRMIMILYCISVL